MSDSGLTAVKLRRATFPVGDNAHWVLEAGVMQAALPFAFVRRHGLRLSMLGGANS